MRTKSSIINFIVRLISSIIPSFLGILLNNLMITTYGSDINGVSATVNQVVNLLLLFEGGFTLATNVSLYKPYLINDLDKINSILSATRKIFIRLGYIITLLAIIISFIAPYFIKSELDRNIISILFLIASVNISIQFLFTAKYNIMFAVGQKEYINGTIVLIFNILSQVISIISILNGANIIPLKLIALFVPLFGVPFIIRQFHIKFPGLNFDSRDSDFSIFKKTVDVIAQKLAGLVFGSTDMIIISIIIGAKSSSVYFVYNMIFSFIRNIVFSLILAPFNAFGQLYAEGDKVNLCRYYKTFQFFTITFISVLITITNILIIPFLKLYTRSVNDINYVNIGIAILFSLCCVLELISNILGSLSNSIGSFNDMKKISITGALINLGMSIILVRTLGIQGVLLGTIIAYIVMVSSQLYLVHIKILKSGLGYFVKLLLMNFIISFILIKISMNFNLYFNNYIDFLISGFTTFIIVATIISIINVIFNYSLAKESIGKVKSVLKHKIKKEL